MPKLNETAIKQAALHYLSRREHSHQELSHKLIRKFGCSTQDELQLLEELLKQLENKQLLSDQRYTEAQIRRTQRFGDTRILHELQQKGIAPETIKEALANNTHEEARCHEVWQRKFGGGSQLKKNLDPQAQQKEKARQIRFLHYRGFSTDSINAVLRAQDSDKITDDL